MLSGITLAIVAIVAYGLASRVWPESLGELEFYARLGQPFGYWNAVGVIAAMGLIGTVWFGTRREVPSRFTALAAPAGALLVTALLLTYSRSGLRRRGGRARAVAVRRTAEAADARGCRRPRVAGAIPAIAWALSQDAFTEDGADISVRADAGPTFGLLLLLGIVLAYALCLAAFKLA